MNDSQWFETGTAKLKRGDYSGAAQDFQNELLKNPKNSMAWNNRGICLLRLGHPFDARIHLDKAVELSPNAVEFKNNRGVCSFELGLYDEAIRFYEGTVELSPNHPDAHLNLGNTYRLMGKNDKALEHYRKSAGSKPDYPMGHLCYSAALLEAGMYEEGWKEFEWRWQSGQLIPRGLPVPPWDGEDLTNKKLLIYFEQGFGDVLQFIRYAPLVKKLYGGTIYVEVRQPLKRLVETVEGIDKVFVFGDKLPELDYVIPMLSLPRILKTTMDTIPVKDKWFNIEPYRVELWKQRLKALPPGLKVGICWAGMSRPDQPEADAIDRRRSTTLESFAPAALVPGVSWVSLQKGPQRSQIEIPPKGMTIGDWMDDADDFYDTAALIEALDLVITVDTAVVHLAASLGKPTWLLSRFDSCWRWLGSRVDSPWYPSLRHYRQEKPGDWKPVMHKVADDLRDFVTKEANNGPVPTGHYNWDDFAGSSGPS